MSDRGDLPTLDARGDPPRSSGRRRSAPVRTPTPMAASLTPASSPSRGPASDPGSGTCTSPSPPDADATRDAGSGAPGPSPVDASAGRVHIRVRGRGPALLCLHGLSAHGGIWRPLARRLEDRFTLYIPDLPGRGGSPPPEREGYTLAEELTRVIRVSRSVAEAAGPHLVAGHSQGAALAVALAAAAEGGAPHHSRADTPPRPAGLVLVCPVTPWTRRPAGLELLRSSLLRRAAAPVLARLRRPLARWILEHRAFGDPDRVDAATVRRYADPYDTSRRARVLLRALADWRPGDLSTHLPLSPPPVRVMAGGRDRRIPPREARRWARALGGRFRTVPGVGHALPEEAPAALSRAVEALWEEVGTGGTETGGTSRTAT